MEWYSQIQDTPLQEPEVRLFWNTRGRAVEIRDQKIITESLKRGFTRCEEGIKAGDYNPIFDKGGVTGSPSSVVSSTKNKIIQGELQLIRV